MKRVNSIDIVRGIVMMIMVLDHVRDLVHVNPLTVSPTDMATTTPALFMTRWITHLCAPTFVFLSGTSAFLSIQKQTSFKENRNFLLRRGIWLVILNFTINNFAIHFDIHFGVLFSQVIAAIGFGFIGLALLIRLSIRAIAVIGLIIISGHDLLVGISLPNATLNMIWQLFMGVGLFPITPDTNLLVSYPIIPWLGIMLAGYCFGSLFNLESGKRKKLFLKIGLGSITLFVLLRVINIYGDGFHWSIQKNGLYTFLSFINTTKYPPSLLFTLMTLGVSIILLSLFNNTQNKLTDIVSVYGKVPLFYWLFHWFIVHFVAMGVFLSQGYHWSDMQFAGLGFGRPQNGGGLNLTGVYILWISIVAFFYPICKWYWGYKKKHKNNTWLRYL